MGIAVVSVQAPHLLQSFQFSHSKNTSFHGSTTLKIPSKSRNLLPPSSSSSSSSSRCSASVVEEGPPPPTESDSANEDSEKLPFNGCKACGREEVERGCNGEGRIQGGLATIPGFGWWPIKAYRPCPGYLASGGRYRRRGQSMDEVAFGRGPVETRSEDKSRVSQRAKKTPPNMEAEMGQKIEKTVRKILESSNMDDVTEFKIRKQASEELALDLSKPPYKAFVRQVVQSFLEEQQQKQEQDKEEEEEEEGEDDQQQNDGREYDDEGNLIICKLSEKRKVTIQDFRGKTLVSIREYFKKDGKELPTSKGISLTEEQWSVFKKNVPAIEKAIRKMDSR